MTTIILAIVIAVLSVFFIASMYIAARRGDLLSKTQLDLVEAKRAVAEHEKRMDDRGRQADETLGKLEKAREEIKKLKKKTFELENRGKRPATQKAAAAEDILETELLEARAEIKSARQDTEQARAEAKQLNVKIEQLARELTDQKKAREKAEHRLNEHIKSGSAPKKKDRTEVDELKRKLETARRKARTDSQVYRVTNSKLELAMDKVAALEKQLKGMTENTRPDTPRTSEPINPA